MVNAKKEKIAEFLIFLYLILFPFGQIIRIGIVHPTDIIAGILLLVWTAGDFKKPHLYKYFKNFFFVLLFSFALSLTIFPIEKLLIGFLYLIRLVSYGSMAFIVWAITQKKPQGRDMLLSSLLAVSIVVALFGWIQYFFLGDLRALKEFGWDDHLYRLVGTFLDPGFTGIILVLGSILAYIKKSWLMFFFLAVSILFTYSRAAYLAFAAAIMLIAYLKRDFAKSLAFLFAFIFLIYFLPRPSSEGVKLERLSSVYPRLSNYKETIETIKKYPVFGVGFDNLCALGDKDPSVSHSCAGSDASMLTLWATTGMIGLILFLYAIFKTVSLGNSALLASLLAVFVNSLFINSLFYPFVLGWLAILVGTSIKEKTLL